MHDVVRQLLQRHAIGTRDDAVQALREIMQQIALLGLWRARFFEHAAFYGGTALRLLHGLDRFSEDLDFTLLAPDTAFHLDRYLLDLTQEITSFGFQVAITEKRKSHQSAIRSAFLKGGTRELLLSLAADERIVEMIPANQVLNIRFEVDTDPPGVVETVMHRLQHPIPFSVRTCSLPDLFAGKMHAVLCRSWKSRVKGRDWYDFEWFTAHHPELRLSHLEARMRQSGHWTESRPLTRTAFTSLLRARIDTVDHAALRHDVFPFLRRPDAIDAWSAIRFHTISRRIVFV